MLEDTVKTLLGEALAKYIGTNKSTNKTDTRRNMEQELSRFVRWCGSKRTAGSLTALEIEEYCGATEAGGALVSDRIGITKKFLTYLHRENYTDYNLGIYAKPRRTNRISKIRALQTKKMPVTSQLTSEGYQQLLQDLTDLKAGRSKISEDIRRAAATKDFKENAPLDAAREQQAQAESRIRELEITLKGAKLLQGTRNSKSSKRTVSLGSHVVLKHAKTKQELSYMLVESREADPSAGKLSASSPVGHAIINHSRGDHVSVKTPGGTVEYILTKVNN